EEGLDQDDYAEDYDDAGQNQREITRPHPKGRPDIVVERCTAKGKAEADEDHPGKQVLRKTLRKNPSQHYFLCLAGMKAGSRLNQRPSRECFTSLVEATSRLP